MDLPGMTHHYTYEEFHPNHEYDIKSHSTEFINCFLDKNSDYYTTFTLKEPEESNFFKNFRDSYKSFSLHKFDIVSIKFDKENAKVFFHEQLNNLIEEAENNVQPLESTFKKLTSGLQFNPWKIPPSFDEFVAFETMNNRGKN